MKAIFCYSAFSTSSQVRRWSDLISSFLWSSYSMVRGKTPLWRHNLSFQEPVSVPTPLWSSLEEPLAGILSVHHKAARHIDISLSSYTSRFRHSMTIIDLNHLPSPLHNVISFHERIKLVRLVSFHGSCLLLEKGTRCFVVVSIALSLSLSFRI